MQQVKPKNSHLGLIIIGGTITMLMLMLLLIMSILIFSRRLNSSPSVNLNPFIGSNPLSGLVVGEIDPALALASLGGSSEADVIAEAIDKARPETAFSGLLFDPTLTNRESSGGFLRLAAIYAGEGKRKKAVSSFELAGSIATLAPDISDVAKADMFMQAGEGLIGLEEPALAKFYLDQAFVIGSKSPALQAAHRRAIYERLQTNYLAIDERVLARASLSLSANPPNLALVTDKQLVLPEAQAVPLAEDVQQAEAVRWRAAQELSALLVARGGNAPQRAVDVLGAALSVEDQRKLAFYEEEFAKTSQLSRKIDITLAQIQWLSIKYRVARQGYGISLVPEWEAQAEEIRARLTKTYEVLYALYADLVIALPEVSQIDKATEERLRIEVLAGILGRYPNYPEEQRQKQLLDATNQLIATQPELSIFVAIKEVNDQEKYSLISLEE